MFCRNCGNEVHEKAVACPQCGVNPRSEKKFCSSCGVETNANQVICTQCGVSLSAPAFSFDTGSLQKMDVNSLLKNKSLLFAAIAMLGYFLTWVKACYRNDCNTSSGIALSKFLEQSKGTDTILSPMLINLFPLFLLAFILADFIPQLSKYKKIFSIGAVVLILYAAIGIFTIKVPGFFADSISISGSYGLYISLLGTIASAFFSGLFLKKQ